MTRQINPDGPIPFGDLTHAIIPVARDGQRMSLLVAGSTANSIANQIVMLCRQISGRAGWVPLLDEIWVEEYVEGSWRKSDSKLLRVAQSLEKIWEMPELGAKL